MSPAEQLVRDYLSRLSAAARGQLSADDRRALVKRTRDFIERKTDVGRPPTAVEMALLLSRLGDPTGLVSQERQRLAALHGEQPEPASRRRLPRMLRGDPDRVRGASWRWPAQEGDRANLRLTLFEDRTPVPENQVVSNGAGGHGNGDLNNAAPAMHDADETAALGQAPPAEFPAKDDVTDSGDITSYGDVIDISTARPRKTVPMEAVPIDAVPAETGPAETVRMEIVPAETGPAETGPAETGTVTWSIAAPASSPRSPAAVTLVRLADWARSNKVEAAAVLLLGIGGAIFPPVWLLGAVVALASRVWGLLDKWLGLAGPVVLTVISLAVGVAAAGSRGTFGMHLHEAWVFADVTSRLTALLGAGYLAWRSGHGRRPPATPPWSKSHKAV